MSSSHAKKEFTNEQKKHILAKLDEINTLQARIARLVCHVLRLYGLDPTGTPLLNQKTAKTKKK